MDARQFLGLPGALGAGLGFVLSPGPAPDSIKPLLVSKGDVR